MQTRDNNRQPQSNKKQMNASGRIKRRALAFTVVAMICSAGIVIAVRAYSAPGTKIASPPPIAAEAVPALPPVTPVAAQDSDIKVALLTLKPFGFDPEEITLSKGRFVLAIDNRSRLSSATFQLTALATTVKSQVVRLAKGNLNWNQILDLAPGEYQLSIAENPEWTCRIVITGK